MNAPRRRLRLVLVTVLAVLLVTSGIALAGSYFGWFRAGGSHPYDVIPGPAAAYVELDLNPSLEQRMQAWTFLRELPEVRGAASGQPDPKRVLWSLRDRLWLGRTWNDFEADVAPWLGDRIGVAVLPHGSEQLWVTALQVTDAAKATAKLQEWIGATDPNYRVTVRDGYALITNAAGADVLRAAQPSGMLGNDQRFRSDLRAAGDNGALTGWVDLAALNATDDPTSATTGRAAFRLRFTGDAMEFSGRMTGWNHTLVNGAGQLGALPASTGAALSVSDGLSGLRLGLPWIGAGQDSWWRTTNGLGEDDITALLGRNLTISTPEAGVSPLSAPSTVGLRVVSADPERGRRALQKVRSDLFQNAPTTVDRVDGSVLTTATDKAYLDELAAPAKTLSGSPTFTRAVPDHARAALSFYLNLQAMFPEAAKAGSPYSDFISALRVLGGQYLDEGSGNGTWAVRIVRA